MIFAIKTPKKDSTLSMISDKPLLLLDLLKLSQTSSVFWHVSWHLFRIYRWWREYRSLTLVAAGKLLNSSGRTGTRKTITTSSDIILQDRWKESCNEGNSIDRKDSEKLKRLSSLNHQKTHENRYECDKRMFTSADLQHLSNIGRMWIKHYGSLHTSF